LEGLEPDAAIGPNFRGSGGKAGHFLVPPWVGLTRARHQGRLEIDSAIGPNFSESGGKAGRLWRYSWGKACSPSCRAQREAFRVGRDAGSRSTQPCARPGGAHTIRSGTAVHGSGATLPWLRVVSLKSPPRRTGSGEARNLGWRGRSAEVHATRANWPVAQTGARA